MYWCMLWATREVLGGKWGVVAKWAQMTRLFNVLTIGRLCRIQLRKQSWRTLTILQRQLWTQSRKAFKPRLDRMLCIGTDLPAAFQFKLLRCPQTRHDVENHSQKKIEHSKVAGQLDTHVFLASVFPANKVTMICLSNVKKARPCQQKTIHIKTLEQWRSQGHSYQEADARVFIIGFFSEQNCAQDESWQWAQQT